MTQIESFTFSPYATNCYVCHSDGEAVIVDASCVAPEEVAQVSAYVTSRNLRVCHLLLTHAHIDHILGCAALAHEFDLPWTAHRDSRLLIATAKAQALMFGTSIKQPPKPKCWIKEGDTIEFGRTSWSVLETPGHAPGSVCFHDEASGFVLAGDVLFCQSVGRTDLPGGNMATLMASIFQKLLVLPDDTAVYSGHGPPTTIGSERAYNPFLQ